MKRVALAVFLLLLGALAARAEGALAIGLPGDVEADGISYGWSYNYEGEADARERALDECKTAEEAPRETRELCRIVKTFRDLCVAVAIDPREDTPGHGWALARTQEDADRDAVAACERASRDANKGHCRLIGGGCDGNPDKQRASH